VKVVLDLEYTETMPIKFRTLTASEFAIKYTEAFGHDESGRGSLGEVKIPGYGWHGCVLNDMGVPSHFYSEDDGWLDCPKVTFKKV
jgi:hypothetical protein